jgi:mRNA-degrading endonuclease YafQ of YafQ-DinJ toxin-antitoxin module
MRFQFTHRFQRGYALLTEEAAARVRKSLRFLAENPRQPGLRVKKIKGTDGIWEAWAGLSVRLTFERRGDIIVLRNVGSHDEALKKP